MLTIRSSKPSTVATRSSFVMVGAQVLSGHSAVISKDIWLRWRSGSR
ncbi:hypothetical protein SRABI128_06295 [Microbacterium sp. Bi128]|nr:hypothetical protein SRABI128_06295 [Microbacterium sp. Bi128]